MEKYSEADIDAMLKQIRDKVDSQSANDTPESENNSKDASPDTLIDQIKASIGDDVVVSAENEAQKGDYDISGYEIDEEAESDEEEAVTVAEDVSKMVEDSFDFVVTDNVDASDETEQIDTVEEIDEIHNPEDCEDLVIDEEEAPIDDPIEIFDELSVKSDVEAMQALDELDAVETFEEVAEVAEKDGEVASEDISTPLLEEATDELPEQEIIDAPTTPIGDEYEDVTSFFSMKKEGDKIFDRSHEFELDESDINVAISLGSKDALEDSLGFVKVREAKSNFIDPTAKKKLSSLVFTRRNNEFRGDNSNQIKSDYRKEKKRIAKRLVVTSFILLVTLFFEVLCYSSARIEVVSDLLDKPYAYSLIAVSLLLCAVLISARKIVYGVSGFLSTLPNYYTTIGMIVSVNLIYSIATVALEGEGMLKFVSSTVLALVFGIIGEYLHVSREMLTFEIVSSDKPKLSLERQERTVETVKKQTYLNRREFFVENTNFVGKYFERTAKLPTFYYVDYIYNVVFSMLSLIVAVFVMVYTKNLTYAVLSFSLLLTVSIPLQREFHTALPLYIIAKRLYKQESAIIGESVIDEYVGKNTIYLDEAEVFGRYGVKVTNLKTYNNFNVVDINYYYLSLFSQISGPLKYAFGEESKKIKTSDDIKLLNVYDGGIEASIDGTNKVFVGTYDFFTEYNVVAKLPEERKLASDDYVTMYMSVNGALCAELQLKYSIDKHFEMFAEDMASSGASVGVRTLDPNVNEEMIKRIRKNDGDTIKVTRPTLNDIVPIGKRSDSGIITCKNHHMIPRILDLCLSVKKIKNVQTLIWLAYSVISLLSIAFMAFFGILEYVSPLYIIAYEAMWTVLVIGYVVNKLKTGNKNG